RQFHSRQAGGSVGESIDGLREHRPRRGHPQLHPQRSGKTPAADNNLRSPSRERHEGLQGQPFGNIGCLVAFGLRLVALCMRFRRLNSGRRAQPCSARRRRSWRRAPVPQRATSIQFRSRPPALTLGPASRSPGGVRLNARTVSALCTGSRSISAPLDRSFPMPDRCAWCGNDPLYTAYHDLEWGVPNHDDRHLFEMLVLEGAQAGLSWITILRKRENYRRAFDDFDADKVARCTAADVERLMADAGIVRNRLKIESAIANARATL